MNDILNRLKENQHWLLRDGFKTSANNARDAFNEIITLRKQVEKLKAELKSIDGALNDPRADITLTISEIILEMKGQLATVTKERDEYRHEAHCCNIEYGDVHDSYTQVREQRDDLAEQNKKMRDSWLRISLYETDGTLWNLDIRSLVHEALAIPDLTTPALNK